MFTTTYYRFHCENAFDAIAYTLTFSIRYYYTPPSLFFLETLSDIIRLGFSLAGVKRDSPPLAQ